MSFNLSYNCLYCDRKTRSGCEIKPFNNKYHLYECYYCGRKINMYDLWMQNKDNLDEVIRLIIYNIVDQKLKGKVRKIIKNNIINFAKIIYDLYETEMNLCLNKIDMEKLMNSIKELEIKDIDQEKIIKANIKLLYPYVNYKKEDYEDEIYSMFKFDRNEYITMIKIKKLF